MVSLRENLWHEPPSCNISRVFEKSILLDIAGIAPNSLCILLTHREARNAKVLRDFLDHEDTEASVCEERDRERQVNKYRRASRCGLDDR